MIEIRRAAPDDAEAAIPLILSSGPDAYEYVFSLPGRPAAEFLAFAFRDGRGFAGYRNHQLAVRDGRVIGSGAFYALPEHHRYSREALAQATRHYGMIGAVRIVRQSLPVGNMMPAPAPDALYVANLAVHADCRGQGVGARLLEQAVALARAADKAALELDVSVRNPRAQALYERTGFRVISERAFRGDRSRIDVPDHRRMRWVFG